MGKRMERKFTVFESSMLLTEASSELQRLPQSQAVIVDKATRPLGLVTPQDLEQALDSSREAGTELTLAETEVWLPPLLMLPEGVRLLSTTPNYPVPLIARAARGVVVLNKDRVVDVLSRDAIPSYVRTLGAVRPRAGTLSVGALSAVAPLLTAAGVMAFTSGITLPGIIETGAVRVVCCRCTTPNRLHMQTDPLPWCDNDERPEPGPHRIDLSCQQSQ